MGGALDQLLKKTAAGSLFDYEDFEGSKQYLLKLIENWRQNKPYRGFNSDEIKKYNRKELTRELASLFEELT